MDPKQALGIGLGPKIKTMMEAEDSVFDYENFYQVWEWALKKKKDFVFPYIVGMNGKKWVNGDIIDASDNNNELLWISIQDGNMQAVKAVLTIPNLFREEILKLDQGTSELKGEFSTRNISVHDSDGKRAMRATNFGVFVSNAKNKETKNMLMKYYKKEIK
jgi:hypothetical protein